jgi:hypothetical protein
LAIAAPKRMASRQAAEWYLTMELLLSKGDLNQVRAYLTSSPFVQIMPFDWIQLTQEPIAIVVPEVDRRATTRATTPNPFSGQVAVHLAIAKMQQDPRSRYRAVD